MGKILNVVVIAIKTYDMVVIASKTIDWECKDPDKSQKIAICTYKVYQQIVRIFRVHPY